MPGGQGSAFGILFAQELPHQHSVTEQTSVTTMLIMACLKLLLGWGEEIKMLENKMSFVWF